MPKYSLKHVHPTYKYKRLVVHPVIVRLHKNCIYRSTGRGKDPPSGSYRPCPRLGRYIEALDHESLPTDLTQYDIT